MNGQGLRCLSEVGDRRALSRDDSLVAEAQRKIRRFARIMGCGSALPEQRVTNAKLAESIDTSDEWIYQRSGIKERRIAANSETTADLAISAAHAALQHAGMSASEIDLIIVATATPDRTVPSTAVRVQAALGVHRGAAFDVQAGCSGFVYALSIADNMIRGGAAKAVLVIGAETLSRILNWDDRNSCVLFGDGSGAVILRGEELGTDSERRGILSTHLHSDGRHQDKICTSGGPSSTKTVGHVQLDGRAVFLHAVINLAAVAEEALTVNGLTCADIDWLVPHQANQRIIETLALKLQLPSHKVVTTIDRHANTSAASIPLALSEAVSDERIKSGDLVLMVAMGAGFTWGAAVVRW
jgi:3-oxoacyl-[acyl-carrier-protein] synthase-3